MQLPQSRTLFLSELKSQIAHLCGVSEDEAKTALVRAFHEFVIRVFGQGDLRAFEDWECAEINWCENKIERRSSYVTYTLEGVHVYRSDLENWLGQSAISSKQVTPPVAPFEPVLESGSLDTERRSSKTNRDEDCEAKAKQWLDNEVKTWQQAGQPLPVPWRSEKAREYMRHQINVRSGRAARRIWAYGAPSEWKKAGAPEGPRADKSSHRKSAHVMIFGKS
jgi:hypothetical protein